MDKQTGGGAFPSVNTDINGIAIQDGMTLRDYLAAKALTTCLGYEEADIACWEPVDFARHAYQVADAMLAERSKL